MKFYISLFFLLVLASCKTTEYIEKEVPVVEVKTEYRDRLVHDSIYSKDSVVVYVKGDTVMKYKEKMYTRYIFKTDTVVKTDTVPQIIRTKQTEIKEVNVLTWWQKTLMYIGVVLGALFSVKLIKKLKLWTLM